jgi:hypothetical protein
MKFHSISAAANLSFNGTCQSNLSAMIMFSRYTCSKVLDLIDRGYANLEVMANGEVGVLHADGRVEKKAGLAEEIELSPVKGSPYGEIGVNGEGENEGGFDEFISDGVEQAATEDNFV